MTGTHRRSRRRMSGVNESAHIIETDGDKISSTACHNSFNKKNKALQHWLASACVSEHIPSSNRPTPIENHMIHVGNQNIHSTHKLSVHRGLVYCSKCGCRKGTFIKNLARACEPPRSYGMGTLQAIAQDRLPPQLDNWPDEG